ncbi:MAG: feruloyl-CoA synthase [Pseudomonadota bacterium]
MQDVLPYAHHQVSCETQPDGSILLRSRYPLGDVVRNTGVWLHRWAEEAPDRVFLAERSGAGWRSVTYAECCQMVRALAVNLLDRGLNSRTPILILSGNGVDHGLLMLAAQYIGVPTVAVAEQYSLLPNAHNRLRHVVDLVKPAMVYAVDGDVFSKALELDFINGLHRVVSRNASGQMSTFADLLDRSVAMDEQVVDSAHATVGPDTIAKILMTSGSTSMSKGVETTQRMLCTNQAQIATILPMLAARPPRILDWLPWNHTFGGSHNFNMMLAHGGSLYIDDGKPIKGLFERSLENMRLVGGTISFNVPVGFSLMLNAFRDDQDLCRIYFEDLDMIFYAGASLPQEVWAGLDAMAKTVRAKSPFLTSSWGLTETAPGATLQHEPTTQSGIIGVPLPAVDVKLVPNDADRYEIRVKGPSIMEQYHRDEEKTQKAFDNDGYFITGDAVRFVDEADLAKGLRFDGRISEDFKLLTGSWVQASALRLDALAALSPLALDVVVVGQDRSEIGLLIIPNREALAAKGVEVEDRDGILVGAELSEAIHSRVAEFNRSRSGASSRIARALVLAEPPSLADGEITAKGNINFNAMLARRAVLVDALYDNQTEGVIVVSV